MKLKMGGLGQKGWQELGIRRKGCFDRAQLTGTVTLLAKHHA